LGYALAEVDFVPHHGKLPVMAKNGLRYILAGKTKDFYALAQSLLHFGVMVMQSLWRMSSKYVRVWLKRWVG
jgi:hypothetical protein